MVCGHGATDFDLAEASRFLQRQRVAARTRATATLHCLQIIIIINFIIIIIIIIILFFGKWKKKIKKD